MPEEPHTKSNRQFASVAELPQSLSVDPRSTKQAQKHTEGEERLRQMEEEHATIINQIIEGEELVKNIHLTALENGRSLDEKSLQIQQSLQQGHSFKSYLKSMIVNEEKRLS